MLFVLFLIKEVFIMKRFLICVAVLPSVSCFSVPVFAENFSDMQGHFAETAVQKLTEKGFLNGYPDGTFRPDKPITRAEVVTMLSKIGFHFVESESDFKDVQADDWFFQPVTNGAKGGVINGYPNRTFQPNKNMTRFEAISLCSKLVRSDNYNSIQLPYEDTAQIPSWVNTAVRNLYSANVIGEYPNNRINGEEVITRGEITSMLAKILETKNWNTNQIAVVTFENVTNPLPSAVEIPHGLLGYLTIDSIHLNNYPVKDGADLATIKTALGHFADTALWDGNFGVCGHNRDYKYDFRNLNKVEIGDIVTYQSRFGTRKYQVKTKTAISETDWSYLQNSENNRITMITCIESQPNKRLLVQAEQIE